MACPLSDLLAHSSRLNSSLISSRRLPCQEGLGCTSGIPVAPSVLARQACLPQNHELSQVGTLLYLGFYGYSVLHVVSKNTRWPDASSAAPISHPGLQSLWVSFLHQYTLHSADLFSSQLLPIRCPLSLPQCILFCASKVVSSLSLIALNRLKLFEGKNFIFIEPSRTSDQISHSVVSDSSRPHESQHARPPCPSPTPGIHSDSCPSSQWCHPAISSSVVPFSSCPQSLPASESFPMS